MVIGDGREGDGDGKHGQGFYWYEGCFLHLLFFLVGRPATCESTVLPRGLFSVDGQTIRPSTVDRRPPQATATLTLLDHEIPKQRRLSHNIKQLLQGQKHVPKNNSAAATTAAVVWWQQLHGILLLQ